jgi:ClpP class serine protease
MTLYINILLLRKDKEVILIDAGFGERHPNPNFGWLAEGLRQLGIKPEYVSYGEYKTEGNPDEELTDESRAFLQGKVDRIGKEFEAAIAKYRGVSVGKVQKDFGRGRMLDAKTALDAGMVDRIGTFAQTIQRIAKPSSRSGGKKVQSLRRRLEL